MQIPSFLFFKHHIYFYLISLHYSLSFINLIILIPPNFQKEGFSIFFSDTISKLDVLW